MTAPPPKAQVTLSQDPPSAEQHPTPVDGASPRVPSTVAKYLRSHAAPLATNAARAWTDAEWRSAGHSRFAHAAMVPAFAEGAGVVDALASLPMEPGGVVAVVVVNRPHDASPAQVRRHDESLAALCARWPPVARRDPTLSLHAHDAGALVVLDVRVPRRRGVGLARKIGCDVALALWAAGRVAGRWIHMADADARWPADFFAAVTALDPAVAASSAALVRPFTHLVDAPDLSAAHRDAALRYEIRLRHHVLGLRYAGSDYAYQAVGSTISVACVPYATVRGVPRRPAAEDFYLLNKLAKVGRVTPLCCAPTELSARVSDRVPFGTGAAMAKAAEDASSPLAYDPGLFVLLRLALAATQRAVVQGEPLAAAVAATVDEAWTDAAFRADVARALPAALQRAVLAPPAPLPASSAPLAPAERLSQLVWAGLAARDVAGLVARVTAAPRAQRRRQLRDGLDAFATLKLMHAWRSLGLADVSTAEALARSPFCPAASRAAGDLRAVCAALAACEATQPA